MTKKAMKTDSMLEKLMNMLFRRPRVGREDVKIAYRRGHGPTGLVIFDDIFPHLLSAWRIAEYNYYMETWPNTEVHSTGATFAYIRDPRSLEEVRSEYAESFPLYYDNVYEFNSRNDIKGVLGYTVFLNNAFQFVDYFESLHLPFVFTLYPGGGFSLNIKETDEKLRRICQSPYLQKIITTQKISSQYLVDGQFCDPSMIEFIYGGVHPSIRLVNGEVMRRYYKQHKKTFDICFVANKYMPQGIDKGYDIFVQVAHLLAQQSNDIVFHVVGSYDDGDIDVSRLGDRFRFYGIRPTDFFPQFYADMDLLLSPNAAFVLAPGCFDGFPLGCSVEAGLCGVAICCTDPLNQNFQFTSGDNILLVERNASEIAELILKYYTRYDDLCELARKGQAIFKRIYSLDAQMQPRLATLVSASQGKLAHQGIV